MRRIREGYSVGQRVVVGLLAGLGLVGVGLVAGDGQPNGEATKAASSADPLAKDRLGVAGRYGYCAITGVRTNADSPRTVTVGLQLGKTVEGEVLEAKYAKDDSIEWVAQPQVGAVAIEDRGNGRRKKVGGVPTTVQEGYIKDFTPASPTSQVPLVPGDKTKPGQQVAVYVYGAAETLDWQGRTDRTITVGTYCGTIMARSENNTGTLSWSYEPSAPPLPNTVRGENCALVPVTHDSNIFTERC